MLRDKLQFAKCLNPHLNKYSIYIYSNGRVLTLNAFLRAIKLWEPKRERFSWDVETRNGLFRYTINTKFGVFSYDLVVDKTMITSWDNQPLIERTVETLAAHREFELVESREKFEPLAEELPKAVNFRFSATGSTGYIYMDIDEPFSQNLFKKTISEIPNLVVIKHETVYSSFGPLESCKEITTNNGVIIINSVWEGVDVGYTLSAGLKLMETIVAHLKTSGFYFQDL